MPVPDAFPLGMFWDVERAPDARRLLGDRRRAERSKLVHAYVAVQLALGIGDDATVRLCRTASIAWACAGSGFGWTRITQ